jgi:hypothetical protein
MTRIIAPAAGSSFGRRFQRELSRQGVVTPELALAPVEVASVASLPAPVQRYLDFMRVVGRPRDVSLRAAFSAHFRLDRGVWGPCEVEQYSARAPVVRVFMMRLRLKRILPVTVRDEYVRGQGRLEAKAFDWLRVAEQHGYELDVGELVTYLNDAILMAPSLLLGPETTWAEVDASSFDVTLTDTAMTVKARVVLDARGAPTNFITTDRFFDAAHGRRVRTEWQTPVDGWQEAAGRMLPTRARAVWQLPTGEFPYADFCFDPARIRVS